MSQVGCCSDLLPYLSHELFCKVIFKSLSFSPEDVTKAFFFFTFLFLTSFKQICKYVLITLFSILYQLNRIKLFQYCLPLYSSSLARGSFWGSFFFGGGVLSRKQSLGRRFSRGMRSSSMFCTTSRGPSAGRFPLAIVANTAHLPATSLQVLQRLVRLPSWYIPVQILLQLENIYIQ